MRPAVVPSLREGGRHTVYVNPTARKAQGREPLIATDIRRLDASEILAPCEAPYPVWSPYDAFVGAATLVQLLEQENTRVYSDTVPRATQLTS